MIDGKSAAMTAYGELKPEDTFVPRHVVDVLVDELLSALARICKLEAEKKYGVTFKGGK